MLYRLITLALVAFGLFALLAYVKSIPGRMVVSGFLEADEIWVGSRVGGRVVQVHVAEGQPVRAGDVLVELDPTTWSSVARRRRHCGSSGERSWPG